MNEGNESYLSVFFWVNLAMDQEVLSNELRFYGLSYVDYVVYAYSKLRRPGQHLRPATLTGSRKCGCNFNGPGR